MYTIIVYTSYTMKNITLSAPEELIELARQQASANGTTLNNEFRAWLASQTTTPTQRAARYDEVMKRIGYFKTSRKYTREEMNER